MNTIDDEAKKYADDALNSDSFIDSCRNFCNWVKNRK